MTDVGGGGDAVVTGGDGDGDLDLVSGGGVGLTGLDDPSLDGDLEALDDLDTDLLDGLELRDSLSASLDRLLSSSLVSTSLLDSELSDSLSLSSLSL